MLITRIFSFSHNVFFYRVIKTRIELQTLAEWLLKTDLTNSIQKTLVTLKFYPQKVHWEMLHFCNLLTGRLKTIWKKPYNFCRACLWWARHSYYNKSLVYVCASIRLSEFVWTITSTIVDGFQNILTQVFSITCRCAIWNIHLGKSKVKVMWAWQVILWQLSSWI